MEEQISISLKPIGGEIRGGQSGGRTLMGKSAVVEVFPEYSPALLRIEENSHLWLLLWFHQSNRKVLTTVPRKINPITRIRVSGLRSPNRPNPIALTLVHLDAVEGNRLTVSGLDAVDGTPVLDIKSYYEGDIIFSPKTPYIWALDPVMRRNIMFEEAIAHHQEACVGLYLAVRMGLVADKLLGQLNTPDLKVTVIGSPCLADTLQGITRARLAHPARFIFREDDNMSRSIWEKPGRRLTITARQEPDMETFTELADDILFKIQLEQL